MFPNTASRATAATIAAMMDDEDLSAAKVILAADAGPGRALYEAAVQWHHHFVCRSCGRLIDVECVVGEQPCLNPDLPGADVDEAAVIFRGSCPDCAGDG